MMRIVIIEDDKNVRDYFKKIVNRNNKSFELIGEASNGKVGLELISRLKPDIVVLDIEMPVMNGIEVMKRLKEQKSGARVIILSCHEEFEYVKDAMKLGAYDYVLKHSMNAEEIMDILGKAGALVQKEKKESEDIFAAVNGNEHLKEEVYKNIGRVKEKIMLDLVSGVNFAGEEYISRLKALELDTGEFAAVNFEIDYLNRHSRGKTDPSMLDRDKEIHKIIETYSKALGKSAVCTVSAGYFLALIGIGRGSKSVYETRRCFSEAIRAIQQGVQMNLGVTLSAGVSSICADYTGIPAAWNQARAALRQKFYRGTNRILFSSEIPQPGDMEPVDFKISELKQAISNKSGVQQVLEELFFTVSSSYMEPEKFQRVFYSLINIFKDFFEGNHIGLEEIFEDADFLYKVLEDFETLEEFRDWFIGLYCKIQSVLEDKNKKMRKEIGEAVNYIKKHYSRDITLEEIADHVNISRVYFSQLFKKETGENFSNYLLRFRLEKARKLLLEDDAKVYSVAYAVGFQSHNYFNNIFKETYGITPNQFRQQSSGR